MLVRPLRQTLRLVICEPALVDRDPQHPRLTLDANRRLSRAPTRTPTGSAQRLALAQVYAADP